MPFIERYWYPVDQVVPIEGDGYLRDPEMPSLLTGLIDKGAAQTVVQIASPSCSILLGEMGSGKTDVLLAEHSRLNSQGNEVCHVKLGAFGSQSELMQQKLGTTQITRWQNEDTTLHLLLDAFDEGTRNLPNLGSILEGLLTSWPLRRLRLLITCRASLWPPEIATMVKDIWDQAAAKGGLLPVQTLHLGPLRRQDVREIAEKHPKWPVSKVDDFMWEIEEKRLTTFAALPGTLEVALRYWNSKGSLSGTPTQLWEQFCLECCHDSDRRKLSGSGGALEPEERLALASRLAAVTTFGGHNSISGKRNADDSGNTLPLKEACGGGEPTENGQNIEATITHLRETLDYALFAPASNGSVSWVHPSRESFLAARYLLRHNVPLATLRPLLCSESGKIVPQMRAVAADLSSQHRELFNYLHEHDPDALLSSDLINLTDEQRSMLTNALFKFLERGDMSPYDLARRCRKLRHPQLSTQILAYLDNKAAPSNARCGAILMCVGCSIESDPRKKGLEAEIESALLELALDKDETGSLRGQALLMLAQEASESSRAKLLPLARGPRQMVSNYFDLKGAALQAVWPDLLSAEDLFKTLEPTQPLAHTTYETFLTSYLLQGMKTSDIPAALNWANRRDLRGGHTFFEDRFIDELIEIAWTALDDTEFGPRIASGLAKLAWRRQAVGQPIAGKKVMYED